LGIWGWILHLGIRIRTSIFAFGDSYSNKHFAILAFGDFDKHAYCILPFCHFDKHAYCSGGCSSSSPVRRVRALEGWRWRGGAEDGGSARWRSDEGRRMQRRGACVLTRGVRFVERPSDLNFECVDLIGPQRPWVDGVGAGRGTAPPRGSASRLGRGQNHRGYALPLRVF
jgi:hypothetical protein